MSQTSTIAASVSRHFDRVFSTLRDAIAKLDDQQWRSGEVDFLIPVRLAYHAVESADFYCSDCEPKQFQFGQLGGNWEDSPPAELPTREQLLGYLDQVQAKLKSWLLAHSGEQMLAAQSVCKWTGPVVLDRALYLLRHVQHHTAQINAELRRRNLPRGNWA